MSDKEVVCLKVVANAGCGDKWTEFLVQQTAAMREAQERGSRGKMCAALKSQLPTMYTSPSPPSSSHYLSFSSIQHGTHLSLMAHRDRHTHTHTNTGILACVQHGHAQSAQSHNVYLSLQCFNLSFKSLSILSLLPLPLLTFHAHKLSRAHT